MAASQLSPEYIAYINSAAWKAKRGPALTRAEGRCQVCNSANHLDVHHRTYERFEDEKPGDLTVLCRTCHELFHEKRHLKTGNKSKPARNKPPKGRKHHARDERHKLCSKCQKRMTTKGRCGPCRKHHATVKLGTRKTTTRYSFG